MELNGRVFHRKWSKKLGEKWTKGVPIEVLPMAYKITQKAIEKQLGGEAIVREGSGKAVSFNSNEYQSKITGKFSRARY